MRFQNLTEEEKELTYDDVFLVPQYTEVTSRMEVDLTPHDGIGMTMPIVVANMNAVAGRRMAETVTRRGGMVVLPQDMSHDRIEEIILFLKTRHPIIDTAVTLYEDESLQTGLNLISKRSHGAVIVLDREKKPVGIFTEHDSRDRDRFTCLRDVMSRELITMNESATPEQMFLTMKERHIPVLPIISENGELRGVVTMQGAVRATLYSPSRNERGQLLTAVAVGVGGDVVARVDSLLSMGVDIIVLDTAHGHQKKMLEAVAAVRARLGSHRPLAAGNVVTAQATTALIDAGATHIKVGIGPGAMCTTRMMTGVGRPQFSSVVECSRVARERGCHVWADGGIRHPRDVALALAAGATSAFFGSWFAGTYESAADMMVDEQGNLYKESFGMASRRAVTDRTRQTGLFEQARKQYFEEGVSHARLYIKEGEESAEDIIDKIAAGVRSTCTYMGARNLNELHEHAVIGVQTRAGYEEGKPLLKGW